MTLEIDETAKKAIEAAETRRPANSDWGILCLYRVPNLGGGFAKSCLWFEDKTELFAFLRQHAANLASGKHPTLAKKVAQAIPTDAPAIDIDAVMERVNNILGRHVFFAWVGDFGDLAAGSNCHAIKLREDFRAYGEQDFTGKPIEQNEIEDFRNYVYRS